MGNALYSGVLDGRVVVVRARSRKTKRCCARLGLRRLDKHEGFDKSEYTHRKHGLLAPGITCWYEKPDPAVQQREAEERHRQELSQRHRREHAKREAKARRDAKAESPVQVCEAEESENDFASFRAFLERLVQASGDDESESDDDVQSFEELLEKMRRDSDERAAPEREQRTARGRALEERKDRARQCEQRRQEEMASRDLGEAARCDDVVCRCTRDVERAVAAAQAALDKHDRLKAEVVLRLEEAKARRLVAIQRAESPVDRSSQQLPVKEDQQLQAHEQANPVDEIRTAVAVVGTRYQLMQDYAPRVSDGKAHAVAIGHASSYRPLQKQLTC